MNYETPEVRELAPAISAIQHAKSGSPRESEINPRDVTSAYEDWE